MTRRSAGAVQSALLALVLGLFGAACGDDATENGSVQPQGTELELTLGTKDFPEQFLLGELYKQALAAEGYQVTLRKDIGSSEVIDEELTNGDIDAYPEYLGVAVTVVAAEPDAGSSAEETYQRAEEFYTGRGQALSEQTPFENVDAIAATQFYAQQQRLTTLSDLARLPSFTLGARPEFEERVQGLVGLQDVYGLTNAEFRPIELGEQYDALDEGAIDTANVFTTDGQLAAGDYRLLDDPERLFGFQHVALVIDEDALDRLGGDRFMSIVNAVNERLTTSRMIEMNRDVVLDGQDEALVAERFLNSVGLVEAP
jgi:glycine betaine/choline ABC-type transport system substrate-binding protein